jgi:outer membrane protein TolC
VYRAELAALAAESNLQDQIRRKQRSVEEFREQLRQEEPEALAWYGPIRKIVPLLPEDLDKTVLDNRLEWQQHNMETQIALRELYKVKRDILPDVDLSFTVEQRGEGDSLEQATDLDETNWSLQVQMNSALTRFPEESALVRKKIELAKLRRNGDSLRRKIEREVRDGIADLQMAERQHQVNRRQLKQAEMALDLAKIRYEKGLSDNLEMLDAESAYSDAELEISRSLVEYNNEAINLAYVMGILNTDWLRMSVK